MKIDKLQEKRNNLIGLKNCYGDVIKAEEPEIVSSSSYDTELTFDSGAKNVRWKANCAKPRAKQNYYQSDNNNLMTVADYDEKYN